MKAIWKDKIIAESEETIVVENNQYFPPASVNMNYLAKTDTETICPWKGKASYYNIIVDSEKNPDAAWTYENPKLKAIEIKNYIAFWKGVKIVK
ncbi:MAG: DUF427 domain-containing protein [Bacteroidetes bacterium]|nr:DUF427 domain-containing protein [Bacteroidota bacterium]